jgi:hypothetical protein
VRRSKRAKNVSAPAIRDGVITCSTRGTERFVDDRKAGRPDDI